MAVFMTSIGCRASGKRYFGSSSLPADARVLSPMEKYRRILQKENN